jgi:hypothetical protein
MHKYFGGVLLLGALAINSLAAQSAPPVSLGHLEVALTYNPVRSNEARDESFWMQGGSAQVEGRFWRGLGIVADVSGSHINNINSSGVGLDMVTATFGPRYTWAPAHKKLSIFGEGLVGVSNGFNSVFPAPAGATTDAHGLAVLAGGGVNVRLLRHLSIRAVEADWLRTQLPNGANDAQNNLRLGTGVVLRFK